MVKSLLFSGLGGFFGTIARLLVTRYFQENYQSVFPLGTLAVNVLGCLIIGLVYGISEQGEIFNANVRLFLTVGFCGGFTTYSSFSNDSLLLLRQQEWWRFATYSTLSFGLCLIAVFTGSSSVPAHVEMMGLTGMGNNPMVGASVAVAVAVSQA